MQIYIIFQLIMVETEFDLFNIFLFTLILIQTTTIILYLQIYVRFTTQLKFDENDSSVKI